MLFAHVLRFNVSSAGYILRIVFIQPCAFLVHTYQSVLPQAC